MFNILCEQPETVSHDPFCCALLAVVCSKCARSRQAAVLRSASKADTLTDREKESRSAIIYFNLHFPFLQVAAYLVPRMRTVVARGGNAQYIRCLSALQSAPSQTRFPECACSLCRDALSLLFFAMRARCRYLTPTRALWFFLNAPFRARRFFDADGESISDQCLQQQQALLVL